VDNLWTAADAVGSLLYGLGRSPPAGERAQADPIFARETGPSIFVHKSFHMHK
jgi:hypothetical protein